MLEIDGSTGEGGGQVLRTALTLALVTGTAIRITRIRAGRRRPGLRPQHLKAAEAAAAVGCARLEGARLGATDLTFVPGPVRPGNYRLDVGTAGAVSLIFQTLLLPLALGEAPSRLTLGGGTHVPWSPAFHYLDRQFLPFARRLGMRAELQLRRAGFYPEGGGEMTAMIDPSPPAKPLIMTDPGPLQGIAGISLVAGLDLVIGRRQARRAKELLGELGVPVSIPVVLADSPGKGTMLLLQARFARSSSCHVALGARGKPAEQVAGEAAAELLSTVASKAAIDSHLADQLLLPLSLCPGRSFFTVPEVTSHLTTNAWVICRFLPVTIATRSVPGGPAEVEVVGRTPASCPGAESGSHSP